MFLNSIEQGTVFIELEDVVLYFSEEQIKGFRPFHKYWKENANINLNITVRAETS